MLKIVEISVKGVRAKGQSFTVPKSVIRVVECAPDQKGYLTEKDVKIVWESDTYSTFSKGPKSNYQKFLAEANTIFENRKKNICRQERKKETNWQKTLKKTLID